MTTRMRTGSARAVVLVARNAVTRKRAKRVSSVAGTAVERGVPPREREAGPFEPSIEAVHADPTWAACGLITDK